MPDEVKVLTGDRRYVTLYTREKIDRMLNISSGVSLPMPSESYRGQLFVVEGTAGVSDALYICMKNSSDVYYWENILQFRFGP